jgi:hypothetical protein
MESFVKQEREKMTAVYYKYFGVPVVLKIIRKGNGRIIVDYICSFNSREHFLETINQIKLESNDINLLRLKVVFDQLEDERQKLSKEYFAKEKNS